MEEEINMYSRMFGPRALVALGVFLFLATGCAELKKTDAVKGPGTRVNQAAHTQTPPESPEVEVLKAQIVQLSNELRSERRVSDDAYRRINDLEHKCGNGPIGEGTNYPVFTAGSPDEVVGYNYLRYSNGDTKPDTPPIVKTVKLTPGKNYPDVICFEFGNQSGDTTPPGRTCFDPMEITER